MLSRLISVRWLLPTCLFVAVACTATGQDTTFGQLLANMEEAERAMQDVSFKLIISQGPRSELGKMLPEELEQMGFSLPQKIEQTFFIKRPYKMLTRYDGGHGLTMKEGDILYSYVWTTQEQTVYKNRLPEGSWPAWPSPASVLKTIHKLVDRRLPNTVKREDDGGVIYILTFGPDNSGRKDAFYVRESSWLVTKHIVYQGDEICQTMEWRDITVNSNLRDELFEVPEGTIVVER